MDEPRGPCGGRSQSRKGRYCVESLRVATFTEGDKTVVPGAGGAGRAGRVSAGGGGEVAGSVWTVMTGVRQ